MSDRQPSPEDALRAMREAYDEAFQGWAKTMQEMVASEEFASASGHLLRQYVDMQEALRAATRATAESMLLPTAEDLARIATLVVNVERKVDEVSDDVHGMAGRLAAIESALGELALRTAEPPPAPKERPARKPAAKRRSSRSPKAGDGK